MIRAGADKVLISSDKTANKTTSVKGENGEFLEIDTDYEKYYHAIQCGYIAGLPLYLTDNIKNHTPVQVGEKVYFHHFVVQPDNKIVDDRSEKTYYNALFEQLYCVIRKKEIVPLNDWLFVHPIKNTEKEASGFLLPKTPKYVANFGHVAYPSKYVEGFGIKKGDMVLYIDNANFDITVEGQELFRMKLSSIKAILRHGKIIPLTNQVIVRTTTPKKKENDLFIAPKETLLEQEGVVINSRLNGVKREDKISFVHGYNTSFTIDGMDVAIIEERNILGLAQSQG